MIVLDSSAAIDLLGWGENLAWVEAKLQNQESVHAPQLLDLEVLAGLRKLRVRGEIDPERATQGVERLGAFPIHRHGHLPFLERIWELRHNVTPYDASYVALAEVLDAPLLTTDLRLARAPGLPVDMIAP